MLHDAAVRENGTRTQNASSFSFHIAAGFLVSSFPPKGCGWSIEDGQARARRDQRHFRVAAARDEPSTGRRPPLTLEGAQLPVTAE